MDKPYINLQLYVATAQSGILDDELDKQLEVCRGRFSGKNDLGEEAKNMANMVIDKSLETEIVHLTNDGADSFVPDIEKSQELADYLLENIPRSEQSRILHYCDFGLILFSSNVLMPGYKRINSKELMDVLLKVPYQPPIPEIWYNITEESKIKTVEMRERKKLWKNALVLIK